MDVVAVPTESIDANVNWRKLKQRLKKEGSELSEKIGQLKMQLSNGKFYHTDVADTEQLFLKLGYS